MSECLLARLPRPGIIHGALTVRDCVGACLFFSLVPVVSFASNPRGDMWQLHLKVGVGPRSFEESNE